MPVDDREHTGTAEVERTGAAEVTGGAEPRVGIMGAPYWMGVAAELFRRAGMKGELVRPQSRLASVRWLLWGSWRRLRAIHHVGGPCRWRTALLLRLLGRPVVWHWIGSDLLSFRDTSRGRWATWVNRRAASRWASAHLADSPDLAAELAELGITAKVVRLLPAQIEADVLPLPERFAALSYWSDQRFSFYGGDTVLELARRLPKVEFRILGASGAGVEAPANVEFLGFRRDVEAIYRESTVLIRLPEHDSLSAMVLEMLARGRYVIYNRRLDHCHFAEDVTGAQAALESIGQAGTPNVAGAAMVRERFSLASEATALARLYGDLGL